MGVACFLVTCSFPYNVTHLATFNTNYDDLKCETRSKIASQNEMKRMSTFRARNTTVINKSSNGAKWILHV